MNGFERLKLMEKEQNNPFVSQIVEYLITRKDMEDKYLNEKKNLTEMNEFIEQKALSLCINDKKDLENSRTQYASVCLDDKQVHLWAIMYFSLPNEILELNKLKEKNCQTFVTTVPNITKNKTNNDIVQNKKQKEIKKNPDKEQLSLF